MFKKPRRRRPLRRQFTRALRQMAVLAALLVIGLPMFLPPHLFEHVLVPDLWLENL